MLQVRERERKAWAQDMARVEKERWDLCEKLLALEKHVQVLSDTMY